MSKYTEGPWCVRGQFLVSRVPEEGGQLPPAVCRTRIPRTYYKHSDEQSEADARLISQSPAMYELLQELQPYFPTEEFGRRFRDMMKEVGQ